MFARMKKLKPYTSTVVIFLIFCGIVLQKKVTCTKYGEILNNPIAIPFGSESIYDDYDTEDDYCSSHTDSCDFNFNLISNCNIKRTREKIFQCTDTFESCSLSENSKYRTIDGSCNNLKHPSWGKADNCLRRILPFDYGDNVSSPRKSCTERELPNARHVSNVFHKDTTPKPVGQTTHFMEWGQMVAHDLSLNALFTVPETGFPIDCCSNGPVVNDRCMSFPAPSSETFYTQFNQSCMDFARSEPCRHCKSGQRVHWNQNTAYLDLSLVYGSNDETALNLRSKEKGMLKVEYNEKSGPMLPTAHIEELCISPPNEKSCYYAGDLRTNQTPFLLAVHTYLLRHHNLICKELRKINPHWDDEQLYQEARRINIAIIQYLTYAKYLPNVLGVLMKRARLGIPRGLKYTEYNPKLDAGITDEYSALAARYGHTIIPANVTSIDPETYKHETTRLRDFYYNPFKFRYGQFDEIVKGMTIDEEMKHDRLLVDDVRNFLYRRNYLNETFGSDLATVSIIRGRDHGLPGYTYYLAYFFDVIIRSFHDLRKVLPDDSVELLEDLYESVHDIDVYSAGLAEEHVPGGIVGPTFGAVLIEQYRRTKFGDRYWFEQRNQAGSFTMEQLLEIKDSSLARILCETTRLKEIQIDPFKPPSIHNPVVPCMSFRKFKFHLWRDTNRNI